MPAQVRDKPDKSSKFSAMQTSDLDSIVEQSLRSFYEDISSSELCGRENEMVNLYALGHLAKHVRPGTILSELTQIGIEVTVRQLPRLHHELKWMTVRKDLVIWPAPRMTLWKSEKPCNKMPTNEPLAVIQSQSAYAESRHPL